MKVIGEGLCRNAGIKKGQLVHGDYHHKVELTEKDLYLLGFVLDQHKWDYKEPQEHSDSVRDLIRKMQADY